MTCIETISLFQPSFHPELSEFLAPDGSQEVKGHALEYTLIILYSMFISIPKDLFKDYFIILAFISHWVIRIPAPYRSQEVMGYIQSGAGWVPGS